MGTITDDDRALVGDAGGDAMKLLFADLVDAARDTTRRQRARLPEAKVRAAAEDLGKRTGGGGRFRAALAEPGVRLIAEVKAASPIGGPLCDSFAPVDLAVAYEKNGAAAVSVLTEEHFFDGSIDHLAAVSAAIELPTLRKDFIGDMYQIFHAAVCGASAVLLIAELLDAVALREFVDAAHSVGLDALVEFHRADLLVAAVEAGSGVVGINNRNLDTMELDFDHALGLVGELPRGIVTVAESAIATADDVARVAAAGFGAILVGTALVTADDPGAAVEELATAGAAAAPPPQPVDTDDSDPLAGLDLPDDIDFTGAVLL